MVQCIKIHQVIHHPLMEWIKRTYMIVLINTEKWFSLIPTTHDKNTQQTWNGRKLPQHDKSHLWRGAWVAQVAECLTSAQVMISRFVGWSPASGSVLIAQSLEPAWDSVSPSFSAPHTAHTLSLSLFLPPSHSSFLISFVSLCLSRYLSISSRLSYLLM